MIKNDININNFSFKKKYKYINQLTIIIWNLYIFIFLWIFKESNWIKILVFKTLKEYILLFLIFFIKKIIKFNF
jgi:uncharacterized protein YdiU (UPF0061 family)